MLDSLLHQSEIRSFLSPFPRSDWQRCIEAALRLGVRHIRKSLPAPVSLPSILSLLSEDKDSDPLISLREKMTSLRKELEVMSKDLLGFETMTAKRHVSPEDRRAKTGKVRDKIITQKRVAVKNRGAKTERSQVHSPSMCSDTGKGPGQTFKSAKKLLFDGFDHNRVSPKDRGERVEAGELEEPRTNAGMLVHVSSQSPSPVLEPDTRRKPFQSVLRIADDFLRNPLVSSLTHTLP